MDTRFREATLEADGGALRLRGVAIRYGDVALVPYRERVLPRAFGDVSAIDAIMNRQHQRNRAIARTGGGGLVLIDSPTELRFEADLPDSAEARDTVNLVRHGVLRGASIEYGVPHGGERLVDGIVTVERGLLTGIGVVDDPAYPDSTIQARAAIRLRQNGNGLSVVFGYQQMKVIAAEGSLRKETFSSNAFDFALGEPDREINVLLGRSYDNIIGSKLEGSASFVSTPEALVIDIPTLPATQAVSDFLAQLAAGSIHPSADVLFSTDGVEDAFIDVPDEENPEVMVRSYRNVVLQAVAVVSRPPRGLEANAVQLRQSMRRRLLWL